jgi:hypothetical protein
MRPPTIVVPLLEEVRTVVLGHGVPQDFWTIDSGPKILDGFMELAALLMASDLRESEVPHGYVLLAYLFKWEADCQSDGWGAFGNISSRDFERIRSFFCEVGLEAEASSLAHQMAVYQADPSNMEALVEACQVTRHALSGDLDRLEYLTQYFCDHANELLYEGT